MKLFAVIVTYKTPKEQLSKLVKQLNKANLNSKQIYIKDNTRDNIGYAAAVNQGLKKAIKSGYENFVILNPDLKLNKFSLSEIELGFEKFNIFGGVFEQNNQIYTGGVIDPVYYSGGLSTFKNKKNYYPIDFVSGSLMFIDRQTIDSIGYLDEQYFMYYEDVDYCYRARKQKLKVGINSKIRYTHFENSNTNHKKEQYLKNSHRLFLKQYGAWWQKLAYWLKHKNGR